MNAIRDRLAAFWRRGWPVRAALVVGGGRGDEGDVHAPGAIDAVLIDLVEHDLLGEAEGVDAELLRNLMGGELG